MSDPINHRNVYEVSVHAVDLKSGKPVINIMHFRNGISTGGGLDYSEAIPDSSNEAFLAEFLAFWEGAPCANLSVNYKAMAYVSRNITGYGFATPSHAILFYANNGSSTSVMQFAATPDVAVGQVVRISGVTAPTSLNGRWVVTAVNNALHQVEMTTGVISGTWDNTGTLQLVSGNPQLIYGETVTIPATAGGVGEITGEALPLYVTSSHWKKTASPGRHFRGRMSLSPHGESQQIDGRLTAGTVTAMTGLLESIVTVPLQNGSTDATDKLMKPVVFSPTLAFAAGSIFTESESYARDITSWLLRPNMGSLTGRKPKLGAVIS